MSPVSRIKIVTDSTCDIPLGVAHELGIEIDQAQVGREVAHADSAAAFVLIVSSARTPTMRTACLVAALGLAQIAAAQIPIPPFGSTFTSTLTRGYWFQAPTAALLR